MVSYQMDMEDKIPENGATPCYRKFQLKTVLFGLGMFAMGVFITVVILEVSKTSSRSECSDEGASVKFKPQSPTCDRGDLWKPQDANVYSPHLAFSSHDANMIDKQLNSTYERSQTLIYDCPSEGSKDHPGVTLVRHFAKLLETSSNTRKTTLPRFWLRASTTNQTSSSAQCTELVQYAVRHTPTLFNGVLYDVEELEGLVEARGKPGDYISAVWENVVKDIFKYWDQFETNVGIILNKKSCTRKISDYLKQFWDASNKVFYFDYESKITFSDHSVYIRLSPEHKSCKQIFPYYSFRMQMVLTDEYDSLNSLQHPISKILCLTNP